MESTAVHEGVAAQSRPASDAQLDAQRALTQQPGAWLRTRGRMHEAEHWLIRSLAADPTNHETRAELAALRMDMGRFDEATAELRAVLEEAPSLVMARCNYATCLYYLKQLPEALHHYRRVSREAPDFIYPRVQALGIARQLCDWTDWNEQVEYLRSMPPTAGNEAPQLDLLFLPLSAAQLREHAESHAAKARGGASRVFTVPAGAAAQQRPLRIGYVSDDLRDHVVGALLVEVLELHDHRKFEIHVFDWKAPTNTIIERRIRRAAIRVHDIRHLDDEQAAARIAALGIDVLVDLKGYMTGHRIGIFRRRAAPVQINWLGYPGTLGDGSIDYIVADGVVIPPELDSAYTERVLRLPTVFFPNDRGRPVGKASVREMYGLPADAFVYCYLGRSGKITPEVFDDWMRILAGVPGSVLWLRADNVQARGNLAQAARTHGLAHTRLVFAGDEHLRTSELVARYLLADAALDTFPYGSHVTASEALWAGCPLVARMGSTFASRVAGSLLAASGLGELVAQTREDYRCIATALGREPDRAALLRRHLQDTRDANPAFDTPRFVRELESAYALAFERYRNGLPPASIDVPHAQGSATAGSGVAPRRL